MQPAAMDIVGSIDQRSLAILVPSLIIPVEYNLMPNPLHSALAELV